MINPTALFRFNFTSLSVFALFITIFFIHDAAASTSSSKENLAKILEDRDTTERVTWALSVLREDANPQLLPMLRALLNDKEYLNNLPDSEKVNVLVSTIMTIGEIQSTQAHDTIVSFLDHESIYVETIALKSIGKYQNKSSYPLLLNKLNDPNRFIRENAIEALGDAQNPESISTLLAIAIDEKESSSIKMEARSAIAAHHKKDIYPLMGQWLDDDNHRTRFVAIMALSKIGDESTIPFLAKALKDENAHLRFAVTNALREAESEQAIPLLIEALQEENINVCAGAAISLSHYKKFDTYKPLVKALRHKSAIVRACGATGLARTLDPRSAKALQKALAKDKDPSVRFSSAKALGEMKISRAIGTLIDALDDEDERVRLEVMKSLRQFDHPRAVAALRDLP